MRHTAAQLTDPLPCPAYNVVVNGRPVAVHGAKSCKPPFPFKCFKAGTYPGIKLPGPDAWGGPAQIAEAGNAPYAFASFPVTGAAEVVITSSLPLDNVQVRPAAAAAVKRVDGNTLTLSLTGPTKFSIEPDGRHGGLLLFANEPETEIPDPDDPKVHYYGPGLHRAGVIELRDGETLYLAEGAVVEGGIHAQNAKNIRVLGRGILCGDPWGWRAGPQAHMVMLNESESIRIEGIVLRCSWQWTLRTLGCRHVTIRNVKLCQGKNLNDDGIDPCSTSDVLIEDCFIRTHDDNISVKAHCEDRRPCEKIEIRHCLHWSDLSRILMIGPESHADRIGDIHMHDCEVLYLGPPIKKTGFGDWDGCAPFVCIEAGEDCRMENITVENITVHVESDRDGKDVILIEPTVNVYMKRQTMGDIRDICFRNIAFVGEACQPTIRLWGKDAAHTVEDVRFENVSVCGLPVDEHYAGLVIGENTGRISFKTRTPTSPPPLDSQAIHLPPLTARSRSLVRFARHLPIETMDESFAGDYAFRDAGSRFSILKSPKTAPGPDECYGVFARDARPIFRKLFGLELGYPGLDAARQAKLSGYNAMSYYRSHVVENFCHNGVEPMPPVEGDCVLWFAGADVLRIRYRLWNKSASELTVRLAWQSEGEYGDGGQAEIIDGGWRFTARQHVGPVSYTNRCELLAGEADLVFAADGASIRSAPVIRTLPAGGVATFSFAVRFAFNDETLPAWPTGLWDDHSLTQAIAASEQAYAAIPGLAPERQIHGDLILKAAGTLRSLRYLDRDPRGKPIMTIHAGKTGCAATWFWDSGVTLPALGLMQERETGAGVLRLLTRGIDGDGKPAVTYENQAYGYYGYQMPVLAWGAGHYLAQAGDADLLRELYDPLARYVRHWLDTFRTKWGLVVHPPGCSSLDDALRWHSGSPLSGQPGQLWFEQKWGKMSPPAFAAPDINAFLVLECRTLAAMARQLGRNHDATAWLALADELAAAINQWLLEPETRTYQDRNIETGVFNGMVSLGSFIPVYAGIAPPEVAAHLCRDYLLSPDHFLTDLPFPVIDRAHPTFRSGGFLHAPPQHPGSLVQHSYWRGRTWIHGDTWFLGALWQSGFRQEADELADRILTAVGRGEGICECYDSLTGFGNGHPEFMWSSAAVLLLADGFYRRSPVAQGIR